MRFWSCLKARVRVRVRIRVRGCASGPALGLGLGWWLGWWLGLGLGLGFGFGLGLEAALLVLHPREGAMRLFVQPRLLDGLLHPRAVGAVPAQG